MLTVALVLGMFVLPFGMQSEQVKSTQLVDTVINEMNTFVVSRRELDFSNSNPKDLYKWFSGKVNFTPPFPPENKKHAMLLGGRLCSIMDKRVVSYMYQVEGKYVSLYIMTDAGHGSSASQKFADVKSTPIFSSYKANGYVHLAWEQHGLSYAMVASLSEQKMTRLAEELIAGRRVESVQL